MGLDGGLGFIAQFSKCDFWNLGEISDLYKLCFFELCNTTITIISITIRLFLCQFCINDADRRVIDYVTAIMDSSSSSSNQSISDILLDTDMTCWVVCIRCVPDK